MRCSGSRYVIAVLRNTLDPLEFTLELYDSGTQRWTSRLLRVQEPQRDRVLPIPDSATELGFHRTTKTIALGPTTVGWVDLWRGILFCDVLRQDHTVLLCYVSLSAPLNPDRKRQCSPRTSWDIAVVNGCIKYIEFKTHIRPGSVGHMEQEGY